VPAARGARASMPAVTGAGSSPARWPSVWPGAGPSWSSRSRHFAPVHRSAPAVQHLVAFPQLVPLEFLEAAPRRHGHQLFGDQLLDPFGFRAPREMDALSPQESVTAMRRLIDTFGPNQSGKFYNYDGREYPW
jgi:hypothetical protein